MKSLLAWYMKRQFRKETRRLEQVLLQRLSQLEDRLMVTQAEVDALKGRIDTAVSVLQNVKAEVLHLKELIANAPAIAGLAESITTLESLLGEVDVASDAPPA